MKLVRKIGMTIAATAIALGGTLAAGAPASAAPAGAASSTASACGFVCNGKPPSWGQCSNGAVLIAQGHPSANGHVDNYMTGRAYYSSACQTMWMVVTNSR